MIDPLDDQLGRRHLGLVNANSAGKLSSRFFREAIRKRERDWLTSRNAIADSHTHLNSDAVVDTVAGLLTTSAKFDDRLPDGFGIDRGNNAA